jgi:hypothetical protein
MKIGLEVEGRLKGLRTVFCTGKEFLDCSIWVLAITKRRIQQIYVSDHDAFIVDDLREAFLERVERLKNVAFITVELPNGHPLLMAELPAEVGLIVNLKIDPHTFHGLRKTDQIKISDGLHVKTIAVENMFNTTPDDFHGDEEIEEGGLA